MADEPKRPVIKGEGVPPPGHPLHPLLAHLVSLGVSMLCPVCGHDRWTVGPVTAPTVLIEAGGARFVGSDIVAELPVFCERCFYVRHFAWFPLKAKMSKAPP